MPDYTLYQGDCLEVMPTLEKGSVDFVFSDLPYGITNNSWDCRIDLAQIWPAFGVACGKYAVQVFTATQPFASAIVCSNAKIFRYDLQWLKGTATGFLNANKRPLRAHETILVFYRQTPTYNPQMTSTKKSQGTAVRLPGKRSINYGGQKQSGKVWVETGKRHPLSYLHVASEKRQNSVHPTQKPVALLEWLIATYTNPGDLVLDPCFGSNTTGVACARLGRRYIGIEKDSTYFAAGKARLEAEHARLAERPAQGSLAV